MSKFWISLDFTLIICEIELDLSCSEDCVISEISRTTEVPANPGDNPPTDHVLPTQTTGATFQISSAKRYVPIVTFL